MQRKNVPNLFATIACLLLIAVPSGLTEARPSATDAERHREATLLVAPGELMASMAQDIEGVARIAGVRLDRVDLDDGAHLLEAIARSRADFLLVLAHGDEGRLRVGASSVLRSDLRDALLRTQAKEVFLAACGLDLEASIGTARVYSYPGPVDARVATIDAIQAWSGIYESHKVVRDGFLPAFQDTLERHGGVAGYAVRRQLPQEPLAGWYETYARNPCENNQTATPEYRCEEHGVEDEESIRRQAKAEAGGRGEPRAAFQNSFDWLVQAGFLHRETGPWNNKSWEVVYWVGHSTDELYDCLPIVSIVDAAIPGYTISQAVLIEAARSTRAGGVSLEVRANKFEVSLCGTLYAGVLEDGSIGGGGEVRPQFALYVGKIDFQIGRGIFQIRITAGFWVGFVVPIDLSLKRVEGSDDLILTLEAEVNLVAHGSLGWMSGSFTADLYGPLHRSWVLHPPSGAQGSPEEAVERASLLALAPAHLRRLADDPRARAVLEDRFELPLEDVPGGSVVDLADPTFHDLFGGAGEPPASSVRLPEGLHVGAGVVPRLLGQRLPDAGTCAPRFTIPRVTGCWAIPPQSASPRGPDPASESAPPGESDPLCAEAPSNLSACIERDEAGLPSGVRLAASNPLANPNGTLTGLLEGYVWPPLDPYCRQAVEGNGELLATVLGPAVLHRPKDCPAAFASQVCSMASARAAAASPRGLPPSADDACRRYAAAMSGQAIATDREMWLEIAMATVHLDWNNWTVGLDLCSAAGACDPGAGGALGVDEPEAGTPASFLVRQVTEYRTRVLDDEDLLCDAGAWVSSIANSPPGC